MPQIVIKKLPMAICWKKTIFGFFSNVMFLAIFFTFKWQPFGGLGLHAGPV